MQKQCQADCGTLESLSCGKPTATRPDVSDDSAATRLDPMERQFRVRQMLVCRGPALFDFLGRLVPRFALERPQDGANQTWSRLLRWYARCWKFPWPGRAVGAEQDVPHGERSSEIRVEVRGVQRVMDAVELWTQKDRGKGPELQSKIHVREQAEK